MLPDEQEVRRELERKFGHEFGLSRDVTEFALSVLDGHSRHEVGLHRVNVKAVCVSLFARLYQQHRSVHVLCELGLTNDAFVLVRAMFETLLRVSFVLRPGEAFQPKKGLPGWTESCSPSVDFRAMLYVAEVAIRDEKYVRSAKKPPRWKGEFQASHDVAQTRLDKATAQVGAEWMDRLQNGSMFGLSVIDMARDLDLEWYYDVVYRALSGKVHASDSFDLLSTDESARVVTVNLAPDTDSTTIPLRMAMDLLLEAATVMGEPFKLNCGKDIKRLKDRVKEVRQRTRGTVSTGGGRGPMV